MRPADATTSGTGDALCGVPGELLEALQEVVAGRPGTEPADPTADRPTRHRGAPA
ncbi:MULTISPECIES: hypothetical protein [Amycolatopsis]|uniref:hypothetical protein n=1 Tax=Amycolatopsis TaxID=1813 RepID=UPI0038012BCB